MALDNTTQCGLVENLYSNVVVAAAVLTGMFVGVSLIDTTTLYYSWLQTGGPCVGIPQAAIPVGDMVVVGTTGAKFNALSAFTTEAIVGYAMTLATADAEGFGLFLTSDR